MKARVIRAAAAATALTFVLTACGQKPGVHVEGGLAAGQGAGGQGLNVDPGAGGGATAPGSTAAGGAATGTGTTAGNSGGSTGTASGGTTGGGQQQQQQQQGQQQQQQQQGQQQQQQGSAQPQGNDRTGVDDKSITFGLHAPVTGAAPLPTTSFEKSGDLYWKNLEDKNEKPLGRSVRLLFRDDKYDPTNARQVCRELASKSFALAGGGGTDQIQACGQLAERGKFPYFSAGVTEAGLTENDWYFASSMTYRQQGLLLANMVAKNPYGDPMIEKVRKGESKLAMIVTNTPNFDDAVQGWEQGLQQFGLKGSYYKTYKHPKGDTSWYGTVAQEFQSNGVDVVYILSSPVDYIDFSQRAHDSYTYNPRYIGVGVSMGLNAVLGSGCDDNNADVRAGNGIFFSPFPGVDVARKDDAFMKAGERHNAPTDDIAYALWGSNAVSHQLLLRYQQIYGDDLTREDFRAVVEQQTGVKTGVFPELNYSPDNHFGAQQVHVLQADCAKAEYKTLDTFISGF